MKNITTILILFLVSLFIPGNILAQGKNQGNQVQNQVKTQNAGEESQLNVNTQESLQTNEGSQNKSDVARQNMSIVSQKVEEILEEEKSDKGIGQQVKTIAQEQKQAQGEIEGQINKLNARQGLMKKLFGADQKAIKNLQQQMEQNQLRIQQLQELQNETTNQAEEDQIKELTQSLVEQNTALEDQIQAEEQVSSLFGWLIKLFT